MKITIFYSWQSETQSKYNRSFIKDCLDKATKEIIRKPEFKEVEFEIQEGIRGEPGSPPLADTITAKRIPNCDIFVADLTITNRLPPFLKRIMGFVKVNYRPSINNNILLEYGVANSEIGSSRIIGISNAYYGSPKDDPQNLPFDIRHKNFPIEYNYSRKTKDKHLVKKNLISTIKGYLIDVTIHVLQTRKNRFKPFLTWREWENIFLDKQQFYENDTTSLISSTILDAIKNPQKSTRLLGLSGLGKTRLLLETFRPQNGTTRVISTTERVLYLDYNNTARLNLNTLFDELVETNDDYITIIDNCPPEIHRTLLNTIHNPKNKISLITLDSNPEEVEINKINDVQYITLNKNDFNSIIEKILEREGQKLSKSNSEKVKEFSQGIPLMAVLIMNSIIEGEQHIGRLDDKNLLDKLLGEKGTQKRPRAILRSCSLFNYIGFDEKLSSQYEFIAGNKSITSIDGEAEVVIDEFRETCNHFLKRQIFEKRGRKIAMRPFPLAMYLAQEWLEKCTPQKIMQIIADIASLNEPDRKDLSQAFAEQMKYMGYDSNAVAIVEKIVGPQSPFDNEEVLDTELGSRLFLAFAEVNPKAVLYNFMRNFSTKTRDQLIEIKQGRRNIVWTLEKLCFYSETFTHAAKLMCDFAIAENETWSNNATGQFLHLFNILLSGTEATLAERWEIVEWGLFKNDEYKRLMMKAMGVGLNYGHFGRTGGAESQGSRKRKDYHPSYPEIREYWSKILDKLLEIVLADNEYSDQASKIIAEKIRPIFHSGNSDIILPVMEKIIDAKNNDWDEGLDGLLNTKKYHKGNIRGKEFIKIEELIGRLTKTDFISRFFNVQKTIAYERGNFDEYEKQIIDEYNKLAEEFAAKEDNWDENLRIMYSRNVGYSNEFGKRIHQLLSTDKDKKSRFINQSINLLTEIPIDQRDIQILFGFWGAEKDHLAFEDFYDRLYNDERLASHLFAFISFNANGKKYFDLLFNAVSNYKLDIGNFLTLQYRNAVNNLNQSELVEFCEKLFSYGKSGFIIAFELLYGIQHSKNQELEIRSLQEQCILSLGMELEMLNGSRGYQYSNVINNMLESKNTSKLASFINKSTITAIENGVSFHLNYDVMKIYQTMIRNHFDEIWIDLSSALLKKDEDYMTFYELKQIIGSHIGGVHLKTGVLFDGDIDKIFEWTKTSQPLAAERLAELIPIFDGDNDQYTKWNPIAIRLIDEHGNNKNVLSNINVNMGTYSWVGSTVLLLEGKTKLFESLKNHKTSQVAEWASLNLERLKLEIEFEKNRDDELYI